MLRACKTMRSVWLWSHALGRHSACLVSTSVLAGLYTLSFSRSILVISPIHYILAFPPMHSEGFRFIVWGLGVELCSPISSWWPQPSATIRNRPQCIDNRMVNSVWLGVSQVWAYSVCVVDMSCVAGAALDAAHVAMKGRGGFVAWAMNLIWRCTFHVAGTKFSFTSQFLGCLFVAGAVFAGDVAWQRYETVAGSSFWEVVVIEVQCLRCLWACLCHCFFHCVHHLCDVFFSVLHSFLFAQNDNFSDIISVPLGFAKIDSYDLWWGVRFPCRPFPFSRLSEKCCSVGDECHRKVLERSVVNLQMS